MINTVFHSGSPPIPIQTSCTVLLLPAAAYPKQAELLLAFSIFPPPPRQFCLPATATTIPLLFHLPSDILVDFVHLGSFMGRGFKGVIGASFFILSLLLLEVAPTTTQHLLASLYFGHHPSILPILHSRDIVIGHGGLTWFWLYGIGGGSKGEEVVP